jgi:outer membrane protein assembly factor BamB
MLFTDSLVVIGTDSRKSHVYAFEKATGRVRWMVPVAEGLATDIVRDGDRVYGVTLEDELLCIQLQTGEVRWRFRSTATVGERAAMGSTPAVAAGVVYFGTRDGMLHAFDAVSGEERWRTNLEAECVTSVLLVDFGLLVGTKDARVHRLDPRDGATLATLEFMNHLRGPLVPAGDVVLAYFADERWYGDLVALEPSLEGVRWRVEPPEGTSWPTARPFVLDDWALAGSGDGRVWALALDDGRTLWSDAVDGNRDWSEDGVRVFGHHETLLYVGTFSGTLYAFELQP